MSNEREPIKSARVRTTKKVVQIDTQPIDDDDKPFDPTVDMLVNTYDDEQTLDEEEALEATESLDPTTELNELHKQRDMPLSELLELYGYDTTCKIEDKGEKMESPAQTLPQKTPEKPSSTKSDKRSKSALSQLVTDNVDEPQTITVSSDEEEEIFNISPDEDEWKKTIMVGNDYQVSVPDGLCHYVDIIPFEDEDKLLWDPRPLTDKQVQAYLRETSRMPIGTNNPMDPLPTGCHLKDDEQALFLLMQCGYTVEEAIRRHRLSAVSSVNTVRSSWSEEECQNFENGLRAYGKNFFMIRQNKVRTKSVGELVQFYYIWKKTERHDLFANKARLEKKKYMLNPGTTDFMERFIEEGIITVCDRNSPTTGATSNYNRDSNFTANCRKV